MESIKYSIAILGMVMFSGTIGYMILEGWTVLDAFYMTIITITTTGFAETKPLSPVGRLFTVTLIITGVTTLAYIGGRVAQVFLEYKLLRRRKLSRLIEGMKDHYIVCGFGRLGRTIVQELMDDKIPFVIIEKDPARVEQLLELSIPCVEGDATLDDILLQAGIKQAKGLVAVVASDAENVYLTLSAKVLNPNIFVVTRAIEDETEEKMHRAGADRVVKPYEIGAHRMVNLLLRPGIVDFIDVVARKKGMDLNLEEIDVQAESALVGKSLAKSGIRQIHNIIVVAIYRGDGQLLYNPPAEAKIEHGDRLIVIGEENRLKDFIVLCNTGKTLV